MSREDAVEKSREALAGQIHEAIQDAYANHPVLHGTTGHIDALIAAVRADEKARIVAVAENVAMWNSHSVDARRDIVEAICGS